MSAKQKENTTHFATIGTKTTAVLKCIGKRKHEEIVSGELVSEVTCETITCSVTRKEKNMCDISYKPTTLGKHKLHIKVDGKPVKGSPVTVSVSSPIHHIYSTPTKAIMDLRGPWGVAVNRRGDVIVAMTKDHCVTTFSSNGDKVRSIPALEGSIDLHNHHKHRIKSPRGVATDYEDNILVTDWDRHCIHKFTSEGVHVITIGKQGDKPLEFRHPSGIGIHPYSNKIYITEQGNHCVQILNPDFTFSNSFGCRGNGNGQFNHPYDVAFDSRGNVYVSDHDNHRVQVFTAEGQFLHHIGQWGTGNGDLQNPYSIVIDEHDIIYITEGSNYRVSKFKSSGEFLGVFGVEKKRLYTNALCGVAVGRGSNKEMVYVSDYVNNCLLLFNTDFESHEVNDS